MIVIKDVIVPIERIVMEPNDYLLDLFASQCMNGLIAKGELPSWSVAHQSFSMAQIMIEARKQYMEKDDADR